jgi:CelD/BcsL family acetyltransferase involved in cellulose biosynthesis
MSWQKRVINFTLRLGEASLLTLRKDAIVYSASVSEKRPELARRAPREEMRDAGVGIALIASCMVDEDLPLLSLVADCVRYVPWQYEHYFVDVEGTFDDYLRKFTRKTRHELRREIRRFADLSNGAILWREYRHPEEVDEFYEHGRQVSRKTYQERLFDGGLPEGEESRRNLKRLAAEGSLLAYVLFHGDKPVAYLNGYVARETVLVAENMGYDPEYSEWSPGTILQLLMIEKWCKERTIRAMDYGTGEGSHKKFFSNRSCRCAHVYFCERRLRHMSPALAHMAMAQISRGLVRGLALLRLKDRVKKLIRKRA